MKMSHVYKNIKFFQILFKLHQSYQFLVLLKVLFSGKISHLHIATMIFFYKKLFYTYKKCNYFYRDFLMIKPNITSFFMLLHKMLEIYLFCENFLSHKILWGYVAHVAVVFYYNIGFKHNLNIYLCLIFVNNNWTCI